MSAQHFHLSALHIHLNITWILMSILAQGYCDKPIKRNHFISKPLKNYRVVCNCQGHLICDPCPISAPGCVKMPLLDVITVEPGDIKTSVSFLPNQFPLGFPIFVTDTNHSITQL